jgi:hypothetical protein
MKRAVFLLALAALLLLADGVLAMSSDNYRLDWFTSLTSGGGGAANSANYAINLTVGQSAIDTTSGTSHGACLGYWCNGATAGQFTIYLPLTLRGY